MFAFTLTQYLSQHRSPEEVAEAEKRIAFAEAEKRIAFAEAAKRVATAQAAAAFNAPRPVPVPQHRPTWPTYFRDNETARSNGWGRKNSHQHAQRNKTNGYPY
jgi:hypothetical protein